MQRIPPVWGDDQEPDVEDAFGDHDIEFWVCRDNKLVPATDEQVALLREREGLARLARLTDTGALALEQTWRPSRGGRMLRFFQAAAMRGTVALTRLPHRLPRRPGSRLADAHGADQREARASSEAHPLP
jgi:hypothetical protein